MPALKDRQKRRLEVTCLDVGEALEALQTAFEVDGPTFGATRLRLISEAKRGLTNGLAMVRMLQDELTAEAKNPEPLPKSEGRWFRGRKLADNEAPALVEGCWVVRPKGPDGHPGWPDP